MSRCPSVLLVLAVLVPGTSSADIILPNIDARVSAGAYSVQSATGTVPFVGLTYREQPGIWNGASLLVEGSGFDGPFTLIGHIEGEQWDVTFTLAALLDHTRDSILHPEYLQFSVQAQHTTAVFPFQPPTGPVLADSSALGSGYPYGRTIRNGQVLDFLRGVDGGTRYKQAAHGPGRNDIMFFGLHGAGLDGDIVYWQGSAELADVPEPTTVGLVSLGLVGVLARRVRSRMRTTAQ